jgi:hypothetical protein
MTDGPRYSFTQPICADCWDAQNPGRVATRVTTGELEHCAFCAEPTVEGIYVRVDPATVPWPTNLK